MAEKTQAQKKAQQKYMEKFAVARVRMAWERYELVQSHAQAQGESINSFINRVIDHAINGIPSEMALETPVNPSLAQGVVYPQTPSKPLEGYQGSQERYSVTMLPVRWTHRWHATVNLCAWA